MPCGCKCRPTRHTVPAPCTDCGPYGSTCCLKMTGLGETWYFRARIFIDPAEIPACTTDDEIGLQRYLRWVDGDPCEFLGFAGDGQQSNLCGGLGTSSPCRVYGDLDGIFPESRRNPLSIVWQVTEDCSEVAFTLYYYDAARVLTRYYGTAPTTWLVGGTPVTVGPFEITPCPTGEPARKVYNICCWQATVKAEMSVALAPMAMITASGTGPYTDPLPARCETDPRWQCNSTEQCGGIHILPRYSPEVGPAPEGSFTRDYQTPNGEVNFTYEVSQDYSHITLTGYGWLSNGKCSVKFGSLSVPITLTIPFTPDWFLTPIVIDATGGTGVDPWGGTCGDYTTATLTLSVCGYETGGNCHACLPNPLYVTIENIAGQVVGGTYELLWNEDAEYGCVWSMDGLTPATGTGIGYRLRAYVMKFEEYFGVPWGGEACPDGGGMYVMWVRVYLETTGNEETTTGPTNVCILCGDSGAFGFESIDISAGVNVVTVEYFD